MKKYWAVLPALPLALAACSPNIPIQTAKAQNNQTYKVSYLFEQDGCKVYRFFDNGNPVYFTNCNGETTKLGDSTQARTTSITHAQ
ncbi:DUF4884 domain-containing protein [Dinghuibacter silviterrae]|uniref:Uncharacterized protein DUF4884 n=1 Tax=Dinghuibacter silviterrae TaxID=1539049 RepID=A0A4R8DN68_9BACT|nr:DUF4884 domain-containing protein [Dinghuibacter silviterrae]TDW99238.1 uncharacterized protein DUF4884 [Dinghuibacter silviterrae]